MNSVTGRRTTFLNTFYRSAYLPTSLSSKYEFPSKPTATLEHQREAGN